MEIIDSFAMSPASLQHGLHLQLVFTTPKQFATQENDQYCSVLAISDLGAKHDFEIWAIKVFFSLDKKNTP